ncbi:PH domain-containing protein [Mycobacterium sp. CVI_P3]|uniref:PH domain-containing protein n=1 Tax=Mycobacterium pinniadriaticum TaxID=2994102 RepID=A0ABT3SD79_9MYCO|nr:PH domain-containing protein [Mycobacterium pinniadriaticum]MCX2930423.1 PH domain-containing protein [Mycobacterium pinniadriaticum]MCX2936847.1 PH domain-containing protein [Mycobacterium pinniadriaticum]
MSSRRAADQSTTRPVVIRISPMAHFASGFLALGLLVMITVFPTWGAVFMVIPVLASVAIVRLRTVADADTLTVRTLLSSRNVSWDEVDGLRFDRTSWARARLRDGSEILMPAVTFATLPLLAQASGGRVPNPYE